MLTSFSPMLCMHNSHVLEITLSLVTFVHYNREEQDAYQHSFNNYPKICLKSNHLRALGPLHRYRNLKPHRSKLNYGPYSQTKRKWGARTLTHNFQTHDLWDFCTFSSLVNLTSRKNSEWPAWKEVREHLRIRVSVNARSRGSWSSGA